MTDGKTHDVSETIIRGVVKGAIPVLLNARPFNFVWLSDLPLVQNWLSVAKVSSK